MGLRRRMVSTDRRLKINRRPTVDYGPIERWQHSDRVLEATELAKNGVLVARTTQEHVLDTLSSDGKISPSQHTAAFRFKHDFRAAGLQPRVVANYQTAGRTDYNPFSSSNCSNAESERSYTHWRRAMFALPFAVRDIVMTVACYDDAPPPSQIPLLQEGLQALVKHYGISE